MNKRDELIAAYECNYNYDCKECPFGYGYYHKGQWVCAPSRLLDNMYDYLKHEGTWYEIVEGNQESGALRECSECGDQQVHYYSYVPNYCSNCGAKMNRKVVKKEFN